MLSLSYLYIKMETTVGLRLFLKTKRGVLCTVCVAFHKLNKGHLNSLKILDHTSAGIASSFILADAMALGIHLRHVRLPLVAITQNDFLYDWLCISLSFDDASIHGGLLTFVYAELS